jgi:hypothetical protein
MVDREDELSYLRSVRHGQDADVALNPSIGHPAGQQSLVYRTDIRDDLPNPLRRNVDSGIDTDRGHD